MSRRTSPDRIDASRPDTGAILSHLKDFQRNTVEYVFRRLYLDSDCVRRFLVADEVGLGKTLVARGLIAKSIDYLWDRVGRIDVVYVCSNTDIARQNIRRMNVTGRNDFCLSSRITLLPINLADMQRRRLNFVSFTPGTSFELSQGAGQSLERELLYWLIASEKAVNFNKATRLLSASAGTEAFRARVKAFPASYPTPHPQIAAMFWERLRDQPELLASFDDLCGALPRANARVPLDLHQARTRLIGEIRRLLAESCLHWLEPDLIILDEFQRFKNLLDGEGDDTSEAAQLAHHLFNYQQSQSDEATAARVLLLSATPYKMYTLAHEQEQDDHYADFERTLGFLLPSLEDRQQLSQLIRCYREQLLRITNSGIEELLMVKGTLENSLRKVMVRTERLATSTDRNGMLAESQHTQPSLTASDVRQYLQLQGIARSVGHGDVLEYWKSAPYLINFMDDYDLKRRVHGQLELDKQPREFVTATRRAMSGMLRREELERYRKLDPANARLRTLHGDTIGRGAWRLLWVPPSLPYYEPAGPYADPQLTNFTKRLVFSCWRVVPKAVSAVLSYEAERAMIRSFRKKARNTPDARKNRRALLRFSIAKGRPTGMPVLALIYPCQSLANQIDPLVVGRRGGERAGAAELIAGVAAGIRSVLGNALVEASSRPGAIDEAWYWALPLLLDKAHNRVELEQWFAQPDLGKRWAGEQALGDHDLADGWLQHIELARDFLSGSIELGPPPDDLCEVVAKLAVAGPGVSSLRALRRVSVTKDDQEASSIRTSAASLARSFLHLFNLPEVMSLLRDRKSEEPYWKSVLAYCVDGNLQAVLDEYAHILVESLGLTGETAADVAQEVASVAQKCLSLRATTSQVELFSATTGRVRSEDPIRLRTRFAMRFGDQDNDDGSAPTRADQVRSAFNSPFWPFVLATTSVGQEGLDFHPYCHAVVHWNLPSNPVDLEQREGRVHRYKGHALRKNIAAAQGHLLLNGETDIWAAMFSAARASRGSGDNDLFPYWISSDGVAKIERHVPMLPHSRDIARKEHLRRSLVMYRMVFGQNRQEDLVEFLLNHLPEDRAKEIVDLCRLSLAPVVQ